MSSKVLFGFLVLSSVGVAACGDNASPGVDGGSNGPPDAFTAPVPDAAVGPFGIVVTPLTGLATTEQGGEATFSVVLQSMPSAPVSIALESDDESEGSIDLESLTFNAENWDSPQAVVITGQDDYDVDGDLEYTIVSQTTVSDDGNYSGLDVDDVVVTNSDDDDYGLDLTPATFTLQEGGATGSVVFTIGSKPSAPVTIDIGVGDASELQSDTAQVVFTPKDYAPQTVVLTPLTDGLADGDQSFSVFLTTVSTDANFSGRDLGEIAIVVEDVDG